MNTKKIGERIRRLRAMKGYSQANIAEDLGITSGAYAKIERGEIDPNTSRLLELAKVLEVNIIEFFEDKILTTKESKTDYGFATKEELAQVTVALQMLTKEIAKLRDEMPSSKKAAVKSKKKYSGKK